MKKLSKSILVFASTAMILANGFFVSCSNGDDDDSTPAVTSPKPGAENGNNGGNNNGNDNQNNGGNQNGNDNQNNGGNNGGGNENTGFSAPDLSSYYKKYFVGGAATADKFGINPSDWGTGVTATKNDADGSYSLASKQAWGLELVVAAFSGFDEGTLANFEYLALTLDTANYTISSGDTNNGVNIKIAKQGGAGTDKQIAITDKSVKNADGTTTYFAKLSDFEGAPAASNEFALIVGGSGTLVVKEIYAAAKENPASKPVTSISITPTSASLQKNGTQQFTVKDSNLVNRTNEATYTLEGAAATGSTISASGLLTVGTTSGTLTVKATYGTFETSATITVLGAMTNLISSIELEAFKNSLNTGASAVTISNNTVTLNKPADGAWGEWSSQLFLNISAANGNIFETGHKYYIAVTVESDVELPSCKWKGDDAAGYLLQEGIKFNAGEQKQLVKEIEFTASFEKFQCIFAFGDTGNANITLSNFIVYDITN